MLAQLLWRNGTGEAERPLASGEAAASVPLREALHITLGLGLGCVQQQAAQKQQQQQQQQQKKKQKQQPREDGGLIAFDTGTASVVKTLTGEVTGAGAVAKESTQDAKPVVGKRAISWQRPPRTPVLPALSARRVGNNTGTKRQHQESHAGSAIIEMSYPFYSERKGKDVDVWLKADVKSSGMAAGSYVMRYHGDGIEETVFLLDDGAYYSLEDTASPPGRWRLVSGSLPHQAQEAPIQKSEVKWTSQKMATEHDGIYFEERHRVKKENISYKYKVYFADGKQFASLSKARRHLEGEWPLALGSSSTSEMDEWIMCEAPGCAQWHLLPCGMKASTLPVDFVCWMKTWTEPRTEPCKGKFATSSQPIRHEAGSQLAPPGPPATTIVSTPIKAGDQVWHNCSQAIVVQISGATAEIRYVDGPWKDLVYEFPISELIPTNSHRKRSSTDFLQPAGTKCQSCGVDHDASYSGQFCSQGCRKLSLLLRKEQEAKKEAGGAKVDNDAEVSKKRKKVTNRGDTNDVFVSSHDPCVTYVAGMVIVESEQPHMVIVESEQPDMLIVESEQPHMVIVESEQPHMVIVEREQPDMLIVESEQPHMVIVEREQPNYESRNAMLDLQLQEEEEEEAQREQAQQQSREHRVSKAPAASAPQLKERVVPSSKNARTNEKNNHNMSRPGLTCSCTTCGYEKQGPNSECPASCEAHPRKKKVAKEPFPGSADDEEVLKDPSRLQGRRISLFSPRGSASGWYNAVVSDCKVDGRVLVMWEETLKSEELLLGDFEWLLLKEVTGVSDSLQAVPAPQEKVGDPNQLVHELVMGKEDHTCGKGGRSPKRKLPDDASMKEDNDAGDASSDYDLMPRLTRAVDVRLGMSYSAGDRVAVEWEDGKLYKGTVRGENWRGEINVKYDNLQCESGIDPDRVTKLPPEEEKEPKREVVKKEKVKEEKTVEDAKKAKGQTKGQFSPQDVPSAGEAGLKKSPNIRVDARTCPTCTKVFNQKGLRRHLASCKGVALPPGVICSELVSPLSTIEKKRNTQPDKLPRDEEAAAKAKPSGVSKKQKKAEREADEASSEELKTQPSATQKKQKKEESLGNETRSEKLAWLDEDPADELRRQKKQLHREWFLTGAQAAKLKNGVRLTVLSEGGWCQAQVVDHEPPVMPKQVQVKWVGFRNAPTEMVPYAEAKHKMCKARSPEIASSLRRQAIAIDAAIEENRKREVLQCQHADCVYVTKDPDRLRTHQKLLHGREPGPSKRIIESAVGRTVTCESIRRTAHGIYLKDGQVHCKTKDCECGNQVQSITDFVTECAQNWLKQQYRSVTVQLPDKKERINLRDLGELEAKQKQAEDDSDDENSGESSGDDSSDDDIEASDPGTFFADRDGDAVYVCLVWETPLEIALRFGMLAGDLLRINRDWYLPNLKLRDQCKLGTQLGFDLTMKQAEDQLKAGQSRPWETVKHKYIGESIARESDLVSGKVVAYNPAVVGDKTPCYWHVIFSDGEEDDLVHLDIQDGIKRLKEAGERRREAARQSCEGSSEDECCVEIGEEEEEEKDNRQDLSCVCEGDLCAICQEDMHPHTEAAGALMRLIEPYGSCGHVFHHACLVDNATGWKSHCVLCKRYYSRRAVARLGAPH